MLDAYIIDEIIKKKEQGPQVPIYVPLPSSETIPVPVPANDIYRRELPRIEIEDSSCPDIWKDTIVERLR